MAKKIIVDIGANTSDFDNAMGKTELTLGKFNDNILKTGQAVTKIGGAMAASFSIATGAIGAFGDSMGFSAKEIENAQKKASSYVAIMTGIGPLIEGVAAAQEVLNVVLTANPIGLIVVAIAALVAGLVYFKDEILEAVEGSELLEQAMQPLLLIFEGIKIVIREVTEELQEMGLVETEEHKQAVKRAEEQSEMLSKRKTEVGEAYDFEISKAKAAGENTFELEQKKREEFQKTTIAQAMNILEQVKLTGEFTDEQRKALEDLKAQAVKSKQEETIAVITENKKQKDDNKKLSDDHKKNLDDKYKASADYYKKEQDLYAKFLLDKEKLENEGEDATLSKIDKEKNAVYDKYFTLIERAKQYNLDTTALEAAQAAEIKRIEEEAQVEANIKEGLADEAKEAKLRKDAEKELLIKQETIDKRIALEQKSVDKALELTSTFFSLADSLGAQDAKSKEQRAEAQFKITKAINLASATVTGVEATMAAYRNGMENPIPLLGPVTGIAYAAAAGLFAASKISAIASTQFKSPGAGASAVGATGASVPAVPAAPSFNLFGKGNDLNDVKAPGSAEAQSQPQIIKAYVSETDLVHTQDRLSTIRNSTEL